MDLCIHSKSPAVIGLSQFCTFTQGLMIRWSHLLGFPKIYHISLKAASYVSPLPLHRHHLKHHQLKSSPSCEGASKLRSILILMIWRCFTKSFVSQFLLHEGQFKKKYLNVKNRFWSVAYFVKYIYLSLLKW